MFVLYPKLIQIIKMIHHCTQSLWDICPGQRSCSDDINNEAYKLSITSLLILIGQKNEENGASQLASSPLQHITLSNIFLISSIDRYPTLKGPWRRSELKYLIYYI